MKPYRKLILWQKAHEFVLEAYKISCGFPNYEIYGITSQLRRAAFSISLNIVEGQARVSTKEFLRFLHISRGSVQECDCLILTAFDLKYISKSEYEKLEQMLSQISAILNRFIQTLNLELKK